MGLFNRHKRDVAPAPEPQVNDVLLRALLMGEPITRAKAMTLPAVSAAVDFVTSALAWTMPVDAEAVVRQGGNGHGPRLF